MVRLSSSHAVGTVKIGYVSHKVLGEDVSRISQSFEIAHKNETNFIFEKAKLKNYHLNSVQLNLTEKKGTHLSIKWRINRRFNHKYYKY